MDSVHIACAYLQCLTVQMTPDWLMRTPPFGGGALWSESAHASCLAMSWVFPRPYSTPHSVSWLWGHRPQPGKYADEAAASCSLVIHASSLQTGLEIHVASNSYKSLSDDP